MTRAMNVSVISVKGADGEKEIVNETIDANAIGGICIKYRWKENIVAINQAVGLHDSGDEPAEFREDVRIAYNEWIVYLAEMPAMANPPNSTGRRILMS